MARPEDHDCNDTVAQTASKDPPIVTINASRTRALGKSSIIKTLTKKWIINENFYLTCGAHPPIPESNDKSNPEQQSQGCKVGILCHPARHRHYSSGDRSG